MKDNYSWLDSLDLTAACVHKVKGFTRAYKIVLNDNAKQTIISQIEIEKLRARIEGQIAENQNRPGYRYLSKETKKERKFIYDQLQNGNLTQLLHAQLDDVYRWLEARLPVAKLMDKDRKATLTEKLKELEK